MKSRPEPTTESTYTPGGNKDTMRTVLKAMSAREVAFALRLAKRYNAKPRVIEALTLEAFDRVLGAL